MTAFDWQDPKAVVVRHVNAIAVVGNDVGDIEIHQQSQNGDDSIVTLQPGQVVALIAALKMTAKEVVG